MIDRRLIEDVLPIDAISAAASSEPRAKGHISTMHIWRARRPLVACRAAIYAALVSQQPKGDPAETHFSVSETDDFIERLASYPGAPSVIREAERQILAAHAKRLSQEEETQIGVDDILEGRSPRPRLLDMFAGGGAIPLEAARLGCETSAIDLNPVAYILLLCITAFPQKYGASLADDIEYWARRIVERTKVEVADVLPMALKPQNGDKARLNVRSMSVGDDGISVVAYYWTRTVPCPNPQCKGTVPLYRQTWLRRKPGRYVALKPKANMADRIVHFSVVEASSEEDLDFDPSSGSEGSSTICPFCPTTLSGSYVRKYGDENGFGQQLMCAICQNPEGAGKIYLVGDKLAIDEQEHQDESARRASLIEAELGPTSLDELIPPTGNAGLATGKSYLYGIKTFRQAFTPRQRLVLLTIAREIKRSYSEMLARGVDGERAKAITTCLGLWLSRLTDRCNGLARWHNVGEKIEGLTSLKRFAMMWDFPEVNLFGGASGDALGSLDYLTAAMRRESAYRNPAIVRRASATELPFLDNYFDAIITDPPYYDNESYSELSDASYIWLRPAIGFLYPDDFASQLTPKKRECVAAAYRQGGKDSAKRQYEECILNAFMEAHRVLKRDGILVTIYAHKTTLGWSTLVDGLRRAGFVVTEAWPLDTETKARVAHRGDAALASSIFLVARARSGNTIGAYEDSVRPELEQIVQERVETLWGKGISGADLVIACVGAGLRAFTRHTRVELANGEDVPAERFLSEVETTVLESVFRKLSEQAGGNGARALGNLDPVTRFYILWRYTYRSVDVDAGEAIIFSNGTHVELDGPVGLSYGPRSLAVKKAEKEKTTYRLRDFSDRGSDEKLGLTSESGTTASAIDVLHRILWLMENRPAEVPVFLERAQINTDQMRLVAQALAGTALKGGQSSDVPTLEQAALSKLIANWRSVMEATPARETITEQATLFS